MPTAGSLRAKTVDDSPYLFVARSRHAEPRGDGCDAAVHLCDRLARPVKACDDGHDSGVEPRSRRRHAPSVGPRPTRLRAEFESTSHSTPLVTQCYLNA